MTTTLVLGAVVLAFMVAGMLLVISSVVMEQRRRRRQTLQRALFVYAADARLRAISWAAVSAMVDETLRLRRGAR